MGDTKLLVLLLLYASISTEAQGDDAVCNLATRYKSLHKYEYLYEAESLNTLNGATNGPKISCKVEIEVPGTCHFVVRTNECTLSEVISVDADGNPVYGPTAGAETFSAQMEKNPLKVIVEGDNDIKLFPEDGELINILNIKRGIMSALAVPALQEKNNKKMPTIYGLCNTDYTVNTMKDIATDVTLERDLSKCDQFRPIKDHTSPLAIITGMHYPLAQLIRSKQTCGYLFDNEQKHMTSGVCTETHLLVPFSYNGKYGVTSMSKQTLSLLEVTEYNERVFDHKEANMKTLHLDESIDMSPNQDENVILTVLRELSDLSQTSQGQKRAHLAHKLVAVIRKMNADTLSAALPEALKISSSLTYQALFQCGTPECSSALMQAFRTLEKASAEIDAVIFAMGAMSNPSRVLVKEMLQMAKFKPSKLIYYATSNAVRRLYKAEGSVNPEIQAVAAYALENIGDCTGDQEHIYLTLRVIGNMAEAMGAASPALMSAVIQCIDKPVASTEVQQAAIQVFRLTPIPEQGRTVLMQTLLDGAAPEKKSIAAYLILMKDPRPAELEQLVAVLPKMENLQVKSFVISHLSNILHCTAQETKELRLKILDALQGNEIGDFMDTTRFSRNYKIGPLEGNMIFDKKNNLPSEVMLEMTLNSFGYDIDMFEVGMEGKELEPTVEALFGPEGFFPDTVMKTIYYTADKMPSQVNEILNSMIPGFNERKPKQGTKYIMKEIFENVDKLMRNIGKDTPQATLYLRLLGAELGYLKTKDLKGMFSRVERFGENLIRMFFRDGLFSKGDKELFLHYIFMDNEFYLPTGPGLPLRVALSGTFTPGVKGGLNFNSDMSEISFMPAVGVEFVTEIGAHFPDYVNSGLEMHTSMYHESGMRAKVAMTNSQIKLTIPALENPVQIFSMSNSMVSVAGEKIKIIPAMMDRVDLNECTPLFAGLKYCKVIQYSDAMQNDAPYFPLSGDSKFAIELHPTGDVSEYTATINYLYKDNIDKVTFDVKAEGTTFEAKSKLMFNRKEHTISTDLLIPDYDIEAGIRIGAADTSTKGKGTHSIQIDFTNKNIPQASLVALAKIEAMKDALLQVEFLVPSFEAAAKMSAKLKREDELTLELESDLKLFETSSEQKVTLKYDYEKMEARIKSDFKTPNIISNNDIKEFLDLNIGQSEMQVRDVIAYSIETTNSYLHDSQIPYVKELRIPSLPEFEVPEKLFLNFEADAGYHFGKQYYTISLPMPLGGKSTRDMNFPPAFTIPNIDVPLLGIKVLDSIKVPLPELFVPKTLTLSLPTLGKAELAGKLHSSLYDLEVTVTAGRDSDEHPSYSANVGVIGYGPVDLLSFKIEGSALVSRITETLKTEISTTVTHELIHATLNIAEEIQLKKKVGIKSNSRFEVLNPNKKFPTIPFKFSLEHTGELGVNFKEISGNSQVKGSFVTGDIVGDVALLQSLTLYPFRPKASVESSLEINSAPFQMQNKIVAKCAPEKLFIASKSAAFDDTLTHSAEVTLTRNKLAYKSDTKVLNIHNIAEGNIGPEDIIMKIETTFDNSEDHLNYLFRTTLNSHGLFVNSNASVKLAEHTAIHTASVILDKNGLTTHGSTSVNSFLTLQNSFNGILHSSKFSLSSETKGKMNQMDIDNTNSMTATISSIDMTSKSRIGIAENVWYLHDISAQAEPYTASAGITSHLKLGMNTELKNNYEIKLSHLSGTAKLSTMGKLMGAHMNQDTEMEIVGLSFRVSNDAGFTSQLARFTSTLQATAAPFAINLNALANGDGEFYLYGKHSAQLYNKILLKAEPYAFAHSHECRFSTMHEVDNRVIFEAEFDRKIDTQISVFEQSASVTGKSKINNNLFSQELRAYNNPEKIGLEVSGVFTYRENQDYSISALLQYDKNAESHVINLPLLESLPAVLENLRITTVSLIEALQEFMKKEEFILEIQSLVHHFTERISEFNLEEKAEQIKKSLVAFVQDCPITTEELKVALSKLRTVTLKVMAELNTYATRVHDLMLNGAMSVMQMVTSLREEYNIRGMLLAIIEAIENVIKRIDTTQLKDSHIPVLSVQELDNIKLHLEQYVTDLKHLVTDFDNAQFMELAQIIIMSTEMYTEQLLAKFITEDIRKISNTLKQLITELDIFDRCKVIYSNMRDLVTKYELAKRAEEFLDQLLELIKQFKIDETIQVLGNTLKSISIPFTEMLDYALTYLKTTDIKEIIDNLNNVIEIFANSLKSFEYNIFVDEVNQQLSELTAVFNRFIVSLEPSKKLEAITNFFNYVLSSVSPYLEQLKSGKISGIINPVKDLIDTLVLNDIKTIFKALKKDLINADIRKVLQQGLDEVKEIFGDVLFELTNVCNDSFKEATKIFVDQEIVTELKQIICNVCKALKTLEIEIPSFTVPLTDLVIPSIKFSLQQLQEAELPEHLHIPRFTILGSFSVQEINIPYHDIKVLLIELTDVVINLKPKDIDDMIFILLPRVNLPDLPAFELPVVTLPHISLPAIPKLNEKYILDIPLQLPELRLPKIPNTLILPALGKLQGRIRINSPIYVLSTSVELRNSTDKEKKHNFIAHINSEGESSNFKVLNYNLDATLRIGLPKMSRLIIADTIKFIHSALTVEHQASVTLYGLSAQTTAQTTLRVTTTPYSAELINKAFFAVEGGMTGSSQTNYKHQVNIPFLPLTSEASLSQSAVLLQNANTITVTVGNSGEGKFALSDYSDEGSHKSTLVCTIAPTRVTLTFTGDTDSATLHLKETLDVTAVALSDIKFKGKIETQSPFIKNSVMVASGMAHLGQMKIEVEATHDTELTGVVSGTLSNTVNIKICSTEINVDIQNNGNTKISLQESLSMKCDLQNNYSLILNSMKQHINTAALIRFSQHKYSYNFTVANNDLQTGIYAAVNGETDLEFLNVPFNTPEIDLSVIDIKIPAMNDVNLYEISGLKYLYTSKPAINVNAKMIYQKRNLISEMSLKSSIVNLITTAGINGDNGLVIHIAATSASVFEQLSGKLEGTSSLTLKNGLKLANGLSLKSAFIEGAHNSTLTVNTETLEAAIAGSTVANINLPILTTELNHKLLGGTNTNPIAESILTIKQKFDLPIINAVGNGAAEHTLKLDEAASSISIESITKGVIAGKFLETGTLNGELNNDASMYISGEQLRSKLKTTGNININRGDLKVEFDVDENLDMKMELDSVYTAMNLVSNNEVNIATFNTKGKHTAKAEVDVKMGSITADVEFDLSQPTTLGDFTIYEKTFVDLTLSKQRISYSTKMAFPLYSANILIEMKRDAPVFKIVFKSSSKSPFVLLEHDLESYLSSAIENQVLNVKAKALFEHNDCTMDFSSVFIPSDPSHTMNVDITSPSFTDMHLRYVATGEGLTASISSPSVGFLGYQLQGKIPSELTSRLYGQCVSAPEKDIDIVNVKVAASEDEKIHFQADYNLEAPKKLILGLKERVPAITSAITNFARKHGILGAINRLKIILVTALTEAYTVSYNHTSGLTQLSVLFRNVVVQKQKAVQHLFNAAVTFLRDTQIKLPGMKEATLPEICQQMKSSIIVAVEEIITAINNNLKPHFLPIFKSIRIALPYGEVLTGDDILGYMGNALTHSVNMLKQLESIDVIIEKLGQALQHVVEKTQDLIDMIRLDFLDDIAATINTIYTHNRRIIKRLINNVNTMVNTNSVNAFVDHYMNSILLMVNDFKDIVASVFPTGPEHSVSIQNGTLKIDFSIPFDM